LRIVHTELEFAPISRSDLTALSAHFRLHGYETTTAKDLAEYYRARHSPKETGGQSFADEANKDIQKIVGAEKSLLTLEDWVKQNAHLFVS
jgi:hypothetical protein